MSTADARSWAVQLAKPTECTTDSVTDLQRRGYTFDVKWDGVRALTIIENGALTLINRNHVDITFRYPDLVDVVKQQFAGQSLVLDGEVVVFDPETGIPRFKWIHQRDAFQAGRKLDIANWARTHPATFIAFDVLGTDDRDCRSQTQQHRLDLLAMLLPVSGERVVRSLSDNDGQAMLRLVGAQNLEGLIAKDIRAPYRGGRTSSWMKLKPTKTATVIVTGLDDKATGWRKDEGFFRALEVAVLGADGALVPLGKVGSGFTRNDLALIDPIVRAGVELVVEVRYQERQPDSGVLRFPTFLGLRTDVDRSACTVDQL